MNNTSRKPGQTPSKKPSIVHDQSYSPSPTYKIVPPPPPKPSNPPAKNEK